MAGKQFLLFCLLFGFWFFFFRKGETELVSLFQQIEVINHV